MNASLSATLFACAAGAAALAAAEPVALPQAHAHNDYEHARPLLDALDHGFCSIEADIWLVDGALLVAHDRGRVRPERTLTALYLAPLRERFRRHRGRIHADGTPVTLLVDVKSAAGPTYAALHEVLSLHADLLTEFRGVAVRPGAVTVIVSGNRDEAAMRAQAVRFAALDGRQIHLDSDAPATLVPWVSENWRMLSSWDWRGAMPAEVRRDLGDWVARAHARGRKLRFWNVPDRPEAWTLLLDAGVDVIGTDNLPALRDFLRSRPEAAAPGKELSSIPTR